MAPSIRSCKPREKLTWMRAFMATCRHCRGEVHCHRDRDTGLMDPRHCSCQRCGQTYSFEVNNLPMWRTEQESQRLALKALRGLSRGEN